MPVCRHLGIAVNNDAFVVVTRYKIKTRWNNNAQRSHVLSPGWGCARKGLPIIAAHLCLPVSMPREHIPKSSIEVRQGPNSSNMFEHFAVKKFQALVIENFAKLEKIFRH
jgi:hypothetical protein